jgi:signal transduction histidine kinase
MHCVNGPNPRTAGEDRPPSAPLRRQRAGRMVAGVSVGIAEHLGVRVLWVRATFAALAAFGGAGVAAYGLLWIFVPQQAGTQRPTSVRERQQGFGLILLGVGLAAGFGSIGGLPSWLTGALGVALVGSAVVWREADESQRRRWRQGARSGVVGALLDGGGRAAMVRVLAGVALVIVGIGVFLAGNATVSGLQLALLSAFTALVGAAVLTIPWWLRLLRDFNAERAARIRSQERAEIASHLHDSVLQTLALIQKQADASREIRRLARGQERELRTWLYGTDGYGRADATRKTLTAELARACGEVEDAFAIEVRHVAVGDCDLDESLVALLAAAREAVVNAAKHAGVDEVSVYAEVTADRVEVYVRDRGVGFDPDSVPHDRHGVADSIRGRMERNGGRVRMRTAPGSGTEVQLEMPRAHRAARSSRRE